MFKKSDRVDDSDMRLWANSLCSKQFFSVFEEDVEAGIRALINEPTIEKAKTVKAFQKVLRLIEEARNLK